MSHDPDIGDGAPPPAGPSGDEAGVVDLVGLALLRGIADTGSLGAAGRRLGLAQPNATRLLRRLERDLRLALVVRGPRGSTLTTQGRLVVDWAAPVLTAAERLLVGVASLRDDAASHLAVGASLTVGEHLAPAWLGSFRAARPGLRVRLVVVNSAQVVRAVEGEELDVGFVETPRAPRGLAHTVVAHDDLVLVVEPGHPWARARRPRTTAEVAATPLLVREPGSGTRETVEDALAGVALAPPAMELSSTEAIVRGVAAGLAPAVVSRLAVQDALRTRAVAEVAVEGPPLRRALRAVWRRGRRLDGPAADFVSHVRSLAGP